MATVKPRVNVPFDRAVYADLEALAAERGCSLSHQVRSLVLEMLELLEDRALASVAAGRRRTLRRKRALSHEQVWGKRAR